jgi:inorganic pyrophosphatase/exopolyphosphatase
MLLCTNYFAASTHLDSNRIQAVIDHHQLLNRSDRRYIQDCTVVSTNN